MVAQPDSGFHGHVGDEAVGTAATAVVVATFATADAAATNRVVCSFVCEGKTYEFDSEVRSSVTFPVALGAMHGELTLTSEGVGYWHVSLAQFATLPSVAASSGGGGHSASLSSGTDVRQFKLVLTANGNPVNGDFTVSLRADALGR